MLPFILHQATFFAISIDFVNKRSDNAISQKQDGPAAKRSANTTMAENESLDLDSSPRLRLVFDAFRQGASCQQIASKLENALIVGLRKAIKQFQNYGVALADLLKSRDCPQALRQLLRKTRGHDYARLLADAAAVSGPTDTDCVAGWIDAILDKETDQICHRVAGSENWPTIDEVQTFMGEVRDKLTPVVERIVTKLAEDPNWQPRRSPKKGQVPVDGTAELMDFSLLGRTTQ